MIHIPADSQRAAALMLWQFTLSSLATHPDPRSSHPVEDRPSLFPLRAKLYLTIIRYRTERPACPFHLPPVWPWSSTWTWWTHTQTLTSLQSTAEQTHNQWLLTLTCSTSGMQSINIQLCFLFGLVCMRWKGGFGNHAPEKEQISGGRLFLLTFLAAHF